MSGEEVSSEIAVSLVLLETTKVFTAGRVFLLGDIYSCGQGHSGGWFLFLFFPISRREKLLRTKDHKTDHNLAFSLQDNVLELLEQ